MCALSCLLPPPPVSSPRGDLFPSIPLLRARASGLLPPRPEDILRSCRPFSVLLSRHRSGRRLLRISSIRGGVAKTLLNGSWSDLIAVKDDQHMVCCSSPSQDFYAKHGEDKTSDGEMKVGLLDKSMGEKEKKKRSKKPPRPPRPPSTSPLDAADQKLISELSELAIFDYYRYLLLRHTLARLADEMNHWVFSRHWASISFHVPPISSARSHGGLISIQFYKKNETAISPHSSSAAPNNTAIAARLEIHGEDRRVTE
ncbi:hypothetical protein GUJ93_ZPchr0008g12941 [Zizania palustris]|uniref:Uncharacterized protein n=1 Tax=Zizania palustris TaxID=103762 RepID=A0A8J5VF74_ZIZPA|nr:hypothetical protein GUJ93_ZPchr0008g12941 [Zizania palustris]